MPDDLTPAAEAFLDKWSGCHLGRTRLLEATATRIRGPRKRVPQVDAHVAYTLEKAAEQIRGKE